MIEEEIMDLQKYRNHLIQNIKNKLSEWARSEETELIPFKEVYRFLHSIKGTSGTLQLVGLVEISAELLSKLEGRVENWDKFEVKNFLYPLIEFIYKHENSNELANLNETVLYSNAPVIHIIDDDVSMLILLKDVLEGEGWIVITNTNPEKAVKQYFEMKPDCLIIDIHLPQKDGFQILEEIYEHNKKHFIPTIMISIKSSKETRMKAYQKGADDFFKKPIDLEEFVAKINRHLQRKKLFDESVLIDELTQVYNRKYLLESLNRFYQDFKRTKQPFSISIVDIDFFKKINDTYGHLMGDQVLRDFAQYIKKNVRNLDMIFRYGGEEFVIIFPKTNNVDAKKRLNELIRGFSQIEFTHNDNNFTVTFSAGLFTVDDMGIEISEALKEADSSLYEAKRLGRARVECLQMTSNTYKNNVLNISVIDDDIIIRSLLAQVLDSISIENFELNIKTFENGPSFLNSAHAKEEVNHFLILDGIMPEMDGLEVLQNIKQGKSVNKYKVLMLTGRNSKYEIERALRLGADDYVTKPFNVNELRVRVERILNTLK
ncbi:response regulator [Lysinibacillus yapensis]|uniref:Response regulator n=2 Tax=Ureibacillus yapensis TaxID=2304605 RepID=A0A396SE39_9BACL|nr:response regulator [Lysinibacillus yapensis]